MHYRPMQPHEAEAVCHLVAKVFCEFVAPHYEPEGVVEFLQYLTPEELWKRLHRVLQCLKKMREEAPIAEKLANWAGSSLASWRATVPLKHGMLTKEAFGCGLAHRCAR